MCDQCRSTKAPATNTRTMRVPVQGKAVAFGTSLPGNAGSNGSGCGQWRKSCCGGGCCGSAISQEPCSGRDQDDRRQAPGSCRQFQHTPKFRSPFSLENYANSSGYVPPRQGSCCSGCNNTSSGTTSSNDSGATIVGAGVCPAMIRNLPCTPLNELKCFGGDCRDDEDTDSEHSREI